MTDMTQNILIPEVSGSAQPLLATKFDRVLATIIDTFITTIPIYLILKFTGFWGYVQAHANHLTMQGLSIAIFGWLWYFLIHGYFLHKSGQSIGKKIVGIQIVHHETNQLLPIIPLVVKRFLSMYAISYIPLIGGILAVVDYLFVFRADRRCLHDLIAGTKVIKVGKHFN